MSGSGFNSSNLMDTRSWFMLFSLSFLWGFSFFFNELLLLYLSPSWITSMRLLIGGILGFILMLLLGSKIRYGIFMWLKMVFQGVLGSGLPFLLITSAQQELDSGQAAILNASTPLFGIIVSHYTVIGDRITWNRMVGVLVGILGVSIMFWESIVEGWGGGILAQSMILLASFCYALGGAFARKTGLLKVDFPTLIFAKLFGSGILLSLWAYFMGGEPDYTIFNRWDLVFSVIVLGVFCTGLAYFIFYNVLMTSGSNVFFCTLLVPWIALFLGYLILDEKLDLYNIMGMIVIMVSLIFIDTKFFNWLTMLTRNK